MNTLNQELHRFNQHLEEYAYAASHDLKEPIRKIQFFTDQLSDQLGASLNEMQKRSFSRIDDAAEGMGNLVIDLLIYSHASQKPHEREAINLRSSSTNKRFHPTPVTNWDYDAT